MFIHLHIFMKTSFLMFKGQGGGLLCHCGNKFGEHGRAYDEGCDNSCPSQTPDSEVINKKCGGPDLQLIFYTGIGGDLHLFRDWSLIKERERGLQNGKIDSLKLFGSSLLRMLIFCATL